MADSQPTFPFDSRQPDPNCGIYVIRCIPTGKMYVGSAANFQIRWQVHRSQLGLGKHHSILLQRAWDKHGPDAFEFAIIELVAPEDLIVVEQSYIDSLYACDPAFGFNIAPTAGSCRGCKHSDEANARKAIASTGRRLSSESIEKIRAAKTGLSHSPETRAKISAAQVGRIHSAETRAKRSAAQKGKPKHAGHGAKVSAALKGRVMDEEWRRKLSEAHMGYVPTDEQRAKLSASNIGKHSKLSAEDIAAIKAALAEGVSGAVLARRFGVSQSTISNIKLGRFAGYSKDP